ncbi:TPA: hypothetical protein ACWP27_002563 [Escherichia coli]
MRPASYPALQNTLNLRFGFFLRYPNTNLQYFIILFLGHRPDHSGKFYLITDNRCRA